jgi:tryptophan synthase alpha chain
MINRLDNLFNLQRKIFSLYFTAGYPHFSTTVPLLKKLALSGVDLVELGFPFSDPIADGPIIQESNRQALTNGMSLEGVLESVKEFRQEFATPIILMGSYNPILQYGVEAFCKSAASHGVDGFIIPDLDIKEVENLFIPLCRANNLHLVLLVTSETPVERIFHLDTLSSPFLYVVSSHAVTGGTLNLSDKMKSFFAKLKDLQLKNRLLVGFGIDSPAIFKEVSEYSDGGIIGSAFIKALKAGEEDKFIANFLNDNS